MIDNEIKQKLEDIVKGVEIPGDGVACTAIRNFLCRRYQTSATDKRDFDNQSKIKEDQKTKLIQFGLENGLLLKNLPADCDYLTQGGEAKVYLRGDGQNLIKVNDGRYYATWLEFFNSLVIHNSFFPTTEYLVLGFFVEEDIFNVVVQQPFIQSEESVDLLAVRDLLEFNGFYNLNRYDYLNRELGILLEDIHDENVIQKSETLFFIDTVFYIVKGDEIQDIISEFIDDVRLPTRSTLNSTIYWDLANLTFLELDFPMISDI